MKNNLVKAIASVFGLGYLPISGAFGSLAGVGIILLCPNTLSLLVVTIGLSLAALFLCGASEIAFNSHDPKEYVLDEVCGMLLSVLFLPRTSFVIIAGFILFRIFDVIKPWPIIRLQEIKHPTSIVWDDLGAGLVSNVILQILVRGFGIGA